MTTVVLNGQRRDVPPGCSVGDLLDALGRGRAGLAAAVNGDVVPRSRWDATILCPDDRVEVLTAAQGG